MAIQLDEQVDVDLATRFPQSCVVESVGTWEVDFKDGTTGTVSPSSEDVGDQPPALSLLVSGAGDVVLRPLAPIHLPNNTSSILVSIHVGSPFDPQHLPELVMLSSAGDEHVLGPLDFTGWNLLQVGAFQKGDLAELVLRGILCREDQEVQIGGVGFQTSAPSSLEPDAVALPSIYAEPQSMLPQVEEELTNSIDHDGISFFFEARSLSAVVRYVYTPIDGNLSDIEVEVNNAEPIKLAEGGGISIEMGGRIWTADDDAVERHLVSCEQVGECVEARWQWKHEEELADFLYRLRIQGKTLIVELEGGNGKAAGVDLGYVSGAVHPRLIRIPYFNFGEGQPALLCTSGVFVSSFLDWYESSASVLYGLSNEETPQLKLNGGCQYQPATDGKRATFRERWILTVSRQFDEVLPTLPTPTTTPKWEQLRELVWYNLPELQPQEEAYVEAYERLLMCKQLGLDSVLVNHPAQLWHDGDAHSALGLQGAASKGGNDALEEYLEAVDDLGYSYSVYSALSEIAPLDPTWDPELVGVGSNGSWTKTGPGRYLLKPTAATQTAPDYGQMLRSRYPRALPYVGAHGAAPPWDRVDFDGRLQHPARYRDTLFAEQAMMSQLAQAGAGGGIIGDGGTHWLYRGLLSGFLARMAGPSPYKQPLLVDFALRFLHPFEIDAGVGTASQFYNSEIPAEEMHSRSSWLDRYLASTVAYGHAACLPEQEDWGLPSLVKTYYLLQKLQTLYLGVEVKSILYHHGGNLIEPNEALVSGAYENSQVQIEYANGLQIHVNGSWDQDWSVEHAGTTYRLPPASFLAHGPDDFLVFSADDGDGRMDYIRTDDYLYCDTRDHARTVGALKLQGAVLLREKNWRIDVYPVECTEEIEIRPALLWPDRRMPPLRVLASRSDEEEEVIASGITDPVISLKPETDIYRFRITLPEWMVEPGN
jgi:hypothetical protein